MWADEALERFLKYRDVTRVLDIGSGKGVHAEIMRASGKEVDTVELFGCPTFKANYMDVKLGDDVYDGVWCSHVLEHQPNVNAFLKKIYDELKMGGVLAVTVPPRKDEIVGGHLTLWNAGLLVYNLVVAGFNCRHARVSPVYDYNISVIVRKQERPSVGLVYDAGDIETLSPYFPTDVQQAFDGWNYSKDW